eukprot:scaffold108680_cov64-Phaeocystis_antarctica.AAC.2
MSSSSASACGPPRSQCWSSSVTRASCSASTHASSASPTSPTSAATAAATAAAPGVPGVPAASAAPGVSAPATRPGVFGTLDAPGAPAAPGEPPAASASASAAAASAAAAADTGDVDARPPPPLTDDGSTCLTRSSRHGRPCRSAPHRPSTPAPSGGGDATMPGRYAVRGAPASPPRAARHRMSSATGPTAAGARSGGRVVCRKRSSSSSSYRGGSSTPSLSSSTRSSWVASRSRTASDSTSASASASAPAASSSVAAIAVAAAATAVFTSPPTPAAPTSRHCTPISCVCGRSACDAAGRLSRSSCRGSRRHDAAPIAAAAVTSARSTSSTAVGDAHCICAHTPRQPKSSTSAPLESCGQLAPESNAAAGMTSASPRATRLGCVLRSWCSADAMLSVLVLPRRANFASFRGG